MAKSARKRKEPPPFGGETVGLIAPAQVKFVQRTKLPGFAQLWELPSNERMGFESKDEKPVDVEVSADFSLVPYLEGLAETLSVETQPTSENFKEKKYEEPPPVAFSRVETVTGIIITTKVEAVYAKVDSPVPTDAALLALGEIEGLGHKSLVALFTALDGRLGEAFTLSSERLLEILHKCRVRTAERIHTVIRDHSEELLAASSRNWEDLHRRKVTLLVGSDVPERLRELDSPPRWLFVQGSTSALQCRPAIAVVGTRQPSRVGIKAARFVAGLLTPYPVVLVSGLAEGIDEEAHQVSLQEGVRNVAFLGHGLNVFFPSKTINLRNLIVERGGAVVSEYLPDETYQKSYFVERNRLQAALADIVIPVEASVKSGTAHTVRFARELKRRVIGIRWEGANGLLAELEKEGDSLFDVRTEAGRKALDVLIRELVEDAGHETYAFRVVERRLRDEMRSRELRPHDWKRLLDLVLLNGATHFGDSSPNDGTATVDRVQEKEDEKE